MKAAHFAFLVIAALKHEQKSEHFGWLQVQFEESAYLNIRVCNAPSRSYANEVT